MAALRVNKERSREESDCVLVGLVDYKLRSNYGNGKSYIRVGIGLSEM